MRLLLGLLASVLTAQPLVLEKTIPLAGVEGRIDHLALDVAGRRLFVAALGNDTVEVIDLQKGSRTGSIKGLAEPQGVLYAGDRLFVANGRDGSVRIYDGKTLQPAGSLAFKDDADNLRFDGASGHAFVGFGNGALGEFDLKGAKLGEIALSAHPESFQLEPGGSRIFVNVPRSHEIAIVDRKAGKVVTHWKTGGPQANYPMALDEGNHRLFVACRQPARLVVFDTVSGKVVETIPTTGDCDDVFYDAGRKRIYAIGGEGNVAVVDQADPDHYQETVRVETVKGARTGLYSKDLDRLFVAVRKQGSAEAAIRSYILKK